MVARKRQIPQVWFQRLIRLDGRDDMDASDFSLRWSGWGFIEDGDKNE